ncbi:flagellar filament capping protein FliD [Planctomicrobium sp. SH668]|uniref:flagellar filament capping protein FliD n=1 Tax=Planctomicrobium sp. SH668 TaxID=3448126 RepID=UPI003F5B38B5
MASINIGGLVSGIDPDVIIQGLLKIQQQQIDQFNIKKTSVETKQTAVGALQTQLVTLRTNAISLASSVNNPFDARQVNVSRPESLIATATSRANAGTYQLKVSSLATAQQVASQGFESPEAAITEGTFSIRVGSGVSSDIQVNSSNNTLAGLADSINFADVGVSASIVQDGSSSYKLLLTSAKTGTDHQITVVNGLGNSTGSSQKVEIDVANPVQAATNATVSMGTGPGAITVTSQTNSVNSLITGVTLNLLEADPTKNVMVTISADTEKAVTAVKDYVDSYNSLLDFLDSQTKYDSESDVSGILQGDYSIINIRNQLQHAVQSVIPGGSNKANRLSAIGITTADNGRLIFNETQLQNMMKGNVSGVTNADLKHLFAVAGQGTNGNISFVLASSKTRESATPYGVKITQAATRGSVTAGLALDASTTIDDSNNSLTLNVDGSETTVRLNSGTYNRQELANHVQSIINGAIQSSGRSVAVGVNAQDQLEVTSTSYGSTSRVTLYASSASASLGLSGGESHSGTDVAGYYLVNGVREDAVGKGQILTGNAGNSHTDGLQVRSSLNPTQLTNDPEGQISMTRGVASRLNSLIDGLMDSQKGSLTSMTNSLRSQIASINQSIENQQTYFDRQKEQLTMQFSRMEAALQQMQTTSSLLGSQLAGISKMASS